MPNRQVLLLSKLQLLFKKWQAVRRNKHNGIDKNVESLEEVSEGVTRIAESSMKVSELACLTTTQAEEGGKAVTNTVTQMNSINNSVMESNVDDQVFV